MVKGEPARDFMTSRESRELDGKQISTVVPMTTCRQENASGLTKTDYGRGRKKLLPPLPRHYRTMLRGRILS